MVATTTWDKEGKNVQQRYEVVKASDYPVDMLLYQEGERAYRTFRSDDPAEKEAFASLYERLSGEKAPAFEGTMVVAMMGTKPTGGYRFEVERLRSEGGTTTLTLRSVEPEGLVTDALTNPYIVLLLRKNFDTIRIVEAR